MSTSSTNTPRTGTTYRVTAGIHAEPERQFLLLSGYDPSIRQVPSQYIKQGYFIRPPGKNGRSRVRVVDNVVAECTVKTGKGSDQKEHNQEISVDAAELLLAHTTQIVLHKDRFHYEAWSVDFFREILAGIIIAEIEHPPENLTIPSWLGKVVEITGYIGNATLSEIAQKLTDGTIEGPPLQAVLRHLEMVKNQSR